MFEWNDPFKKHDLHRRFRLWLEAEVQGLENLKGIAGGLGMWNQTRLELLKEMKERAKFGDEQSVFLRLDPLSKAYINQRFPDLFEDPPPPWQPAVPEPPKPWDLPDADPFPPPWRRGMPEPEPKPWVPPDANPFPPPWKPGAPERKPWDPPDPDPFPPPWKR